MVPFWIRVATLMPEQCIYTAWCGLVWPGVAWAALGLWMPRIGLRLDVVVHLNPNHRITLQMDQNIQPESPAAYCGPGGQSAEKVL